MTNKQGILFLFALLFSGITLFSQDPVYSHFYANSIQLNPSLAGVEGPARVYIGYRNQWPNSGSSYLTYQAAYDQYVEKLQGGIGIRVLNDKQGGGVFNAYNLDLMYSYQFKVSRFWNFSGGIQAGMGQRSFNPGSLVFGDMYNPIDGTIIQGLDQLNGYSRIYPDFAAGFSGFYKNLYGGIALHHLFNPVITSGADPTGSVPRKFSAHLGAIIPIIKKGIGKEIMQLSPNLVFIQQENIQQINYGLDMVFRDFLFGLWTRHDFFFNYGNIIFTTGYGTDRLRFRYSYDVKLSSPTLRIPNMGAHEFSLLIIYDSSGIRNKRGTIKYPKF